MWKYYFSEAMQKSNGFKPVEELPNRDDIYFIRAARVIAPDGTIVKDRTDAGLPLRTDVPADADQPPRGG